MQSIIHRNQSMKILCKSKHFPGRYKRKHQCVFFWTQCSYSNNSNSRSISHSSSSHLLPVWSSESGWLTSSVCFDVLAHVFMQTLNCFPHSEHRICTQTHPGTNEKTSADILCVCPCHVEHSHQFWFEQDGQDSDSMHNTSVFPLISWWMAIYV